MKLRRLMFTVVAAVALVASVAIPMPAQAQSTECDRIFYELNTISIYDPCDITCTSRDSVAADRPEILNRDYAGRSILSSAQLEIIRQNTPTYQAAAKEAQVPWQVIAALHYRENGLKRENPSNGFGIYQDLDKTGGEYLRGTVTNDEFLKQSIWAANYFKSKASKPTQLANGDIKQIKEAFLGYNNHDGRSAKYAEQAKSLGFSDSQAYEGSPYVMNKTDGKRDPAALVKVEPGTTPEQKAPWGEVVTEGGPLIYPAGNEYGAFVVFAALAGIDQSGCTTGLTEGGMDLETAKAFMDIYINSPDSINYIGGAARDSSYGALANCVSFSAYFVNKYTSLTPSPAPNGYLFVGALLNRFPDVPSGSEPQPYSVFSSVKSANHTGIILGVNQEAGTLIIGDQGYNKPLRPAKEVSIEWFQNFYKPTYAYVAEFLKEDL